MHIKTLVSASTLAIALGFAAPAFAQTAPAATSIGGQTLSEADMTRVQVYCEDLQTEANQAVGASGSESDTNDDDETDNGGADSATDTDSEDDHDTAAVGSIDMDLITVESCAEAGFITPTAE